MDNAILYLRYSTAEQADGQSEQRQTQSAEQWSKEHGAKLVKTYKDLGISGGKGADGRKALKELLEDLDQGMVPRYLLIEDVDRLSRMLPLDSLNLISKILECGITIVSLRDGQTLTKANWQSSQSFLILSLKTTLANEERQKRIYRGKAAWKQKRIDSKTKIYTKKLPGWLTVENDTIVPIPKHVETVQRIFKLSSEGLGIISIIRIFNEQRVASFHGKDWNKAIIHNTLTGEQVLGHFQPKTNINGKRIEDGDKILDYFPQIIEHDLFYQVQAKLKQRNSYKGTGYKNPKTPYRNNLFAGIIKCSDCGASLIQLVRSRHGYTYLVCGNAHKHKMCSYKTVATNILEECFTEWVFCDKRFLSKLRPQSASSTGALRLQIDGVKKQLTKMMAIIEASDDVPPKIIAQRMSALESQMEKLQADLQKAVLEESSMTNIPGKIEEMGETIQDDIKTPLGRAKISSVLKDAIDEIVVNPKLCQMRIAWKKNLGYEGQDLIAWDRKGKEWWVANSHWDPDEENGGLRTLWCLNKKPSTMAELTA